MVFNDLKYYHLLLIFAKLKYDKEKGATLNDKFVVSVFSEYLGEHPDTKKLSLNERASSGALKNCFTNIKKGHFDEFKSTSKRVVPNSIASYCGYKDFNDFKSKYNTLKIHEDELTNIKYSNWYDYVVENNSISISWCYRVLESLNIDINNDSRLKGLEKLPNNWLSPNFCLDLELNTEGIITHVISSNMKWADHYKHKIVETAKSKNAKYRYLLTTSRGEVNMFNLQRLCADAGVDEQIQVIKIDAPIKTKRPWFNEYDKLFNPIAGVSFPLPNDIVIYTNIPARKTRNIDYIFRDRNGNYSLAVIGTTPFNIKQSTQEIDNYYDIALAAETGKEILTWFRAVWELLTDEKIV